MINELIHQLENFSRIRPAVTLEIGALNGEYSELLRKHFEVPQEQVFMVEPNPKWSAWLHATFPRATTVQKAVASRPGQFVLNSVVSHELRAQGCSSLLQRIDGWQHQLMYAPVLVSAITGRSLLLEEVRKPVDVCIVDVEGMAYDVLTSFGDQLTTIKSFMIECEHEEIFRGQKQYEDVARLLESHGYRLMAFRYSYANQSDSVWIRNDCVDLKYKAPAQDERPSSVAA